MKDIAIRVENLSKQYRIGHRESYKALRDVLADSFSAPFRALRSVLNGERLNSSGAQGSDTIWALRDVSFEVERGEVVGVIGRNGAGKSTLLKILSRITEPTTGRVEIHGRVGSLLEVGTGFNPELTGRENIYLNGAILGMKKIEIERRFDEIVAFAEVEKFIDTPVKRYSSGMHMRLAFAVAAHLEPEILIVDEVLAVGDAAFQKKCLGKMGDVARQGRTVLLVSHNMPSIESLCERAILLNNGRIAFCGKPVEAITRYLGQKMVSSLAFTDLTTHPKRVTKTEPIFKSICLLNHLSEETTVFRAGDTIIFEMMVDISDLKLNSPRIIVAIDDDLGRRICTFSTEYMVGELFELMGSHVIRCYWENCRLAPGIYSVKLNIKNHLNRLDTIEEATSFEVYTSDIYGTGKIPENSNFGVFIPDGKWTFEKVLVNETPKVKDVII